MDGPGRRAAIIGPERAKAARALVAVLLLAGCIPVSSFVGRPAAVPAEGEGCVGWGIAQNAVFGTESTPGEQTDERVVAGDGCLFGDFALGHRSDLRIMIGGEGTEFGVVFRHQVAGSPYEPLRQESERRVPVDISVELGLGATVDTNTSASSDTRRYGNVHAGVNVSFGTGRYLPYVSYRYHWGTYSYEDDGAGAFRHELLFLGLEVDTTSQSTGNRMKITPEVFFGRSPPWGPQGDKAWNTIGFNVVFTVPVSSEPCPGMRAGARDNGGG